MRANEFVTEEPRTAAPKPEIVSVQDDGKTITIKVRGNDGAVRTIVNSNPAVLQQQLNLKYGLRLPHSIARKFAGMPAAMAEDQADNPDSWQSQAADQRRDAETVRMADQDAAAGGLAEEAVDEDLSRRGFLKGAGAAAVAGAAGGAKADRSWGKDEFSGKDKATMNAENFPGAFLAYKEEYSQLYLNLREPTNGSPMNIKAGRLHYPKITSTDYKIKFSNNITNPEDNNFVIPGKGQVFSFPLNQFGNYQGSGLMLVTSPKIFKSIEDKFFHSNQIIVRVEIDGQPTNLVFNETASVIDLRNRVNQQVVQPEQPPEKQQKQYTPLNPKVQYALATKRITQEQYNKARDAGYSDDEIAKWVEGIKESVEQGVAESGLNEKSTSQAQFRTMAAAAHNPKFAKKVGISPDVAREFHGADRKQNYKSLPKKAAEDASWGMAPEGRGYKK